MEVACHLVALQDLLLQAVLQHLQVDPMVVFLLGQVLQPALQVVLLLVLQVVLLVAHQVNLQVVQHLVHLVLPKVANWNHQELLILHQEGPSHQGLLVHQGLQVHQGLLVHQVHPDLRIHLAFRRQEVPNQVHQGLEKAPYFLEFDFCFFRGFD